MKYLSLLMFFVLAMPLAAAAQTQTVGSGGRVTAEVIATSSTAVVKGAPFSAEGISESFQTLTDGNKISRSFTTRMFRDSDGRFRREDVSAPNSPVASALGMQTISIFDPIANYRYLLNPATKTVRRFGVPAGRGEGAVIVNGQVLSPAVRAQVETTAGQRTQMVILPSIAPLATVSVVGSNPASSVLATGSGTGFAITTTNGVEPKSESLGARDFEGVQAEGTRTVTTIPAGAIGNERAIEIVYERWYSKELQMIVYSKHSDPRFGEQTYRLVNINRSEPDRSLFTPPTDYKVVTETAPAGFTTVTTTKQQ